MFDLDDLDAQEDVAQVLTPEGEEEPLPTLPGFKPAGHVGGCGKDQRLRLLCLHGGGMNRGVMQLQMSMLFCDKGLKDMVEYECVDGWTIDLDACAPESKISFLMGIPVNVGGEPHCWYYKSPHRSPMELWIDLKKSCDEMIEYIKTNGPWDGLCGFSEGGALVCQLARLAEEGHPDLQEQFKFVLCMSHHWPRPCIQPECRPRNVLRVPSLHILEREGDQYTTNDFEDMVLHWDPDFREVIWHDQGHKPPRLLDERLERFRSFIETFHAGNEQNWKPSFEPDDALHGLRLPLPRRSAAILAKPPPSRPLQVICFPDLAQPSEECFSRLRERLNDVGVGSLLDLMWPGREFPELPEFQGYKGATHPCFRDTDVVPQDVISGSQDIFHGVLGSGQFDGRYVVFIGYGLGAYLALECARALRSRGDSGQPWHLYAVQPPAMFPVPRVGCLGVCEVTCLLPTMETTGERWRFSMATRGAYKVEVVLDSKRAEAKMEERRWLDRLGSKSGAEEVDQLLSKRRTWEDAIAEDLKAALLG
eukprot:CAMPEP_0180422572 /NCGR_PEP_ID=MMETSP1036_2-20121128/3745_1 /TAXON_ID=632150 /ORGANISM="Azadinium spinosum, Strain 3D9" /LENGTH=533 /DNA_ID=CAMNT_0022427891 /DNA_START=66 /DNA_END=1663 /DNA_ORIENTATION=+